MSVAFCTTTCPQCGYDKAYGELDTLTRERYILCSACGYRWSLYALKDRQVDPSGRTLKLNRNGYPILRQHESRGYGSYAIMKKAGPGMFGSFRKAPSNRQICQFERLLASDPDIDREKCFLTLWDEESRSVRPVIGTVRTMVYDEELEQAYSGSLTDQKNSVGNYSIEGGNQDG